MRALDPSLLRMLSFLTRRQAWLSPPEIARAFRPDDRPVSARTVFRWFSFLEEQLGLAYFPHPRMNRLGLAEVSVRIRGLRSPAVLSTVPWAYSFWVELGLDGRPFLTQDYWIPGAQLKAFRDYWATAEELGLVQSAEILASRNTHFLFSPFHEVVAAEGIAEFRSDVDNEYFANLLRTHLRESYEVCFGERIAASLAGSERFGPIIRHHHERWDGQGYPDGLRAEAIPMGARIISVVDAFDAMTQYRPYRSPRSVPEAIKELRRERGRQFDPRLVDTFIQVLEWDSVI